MGKSSSGPDVTDIAMMMGAMELLHDCRVSLIVTTRGQGHNGMLHIASSAKFHVVGALNNTVEIVVQSEWPCRHCATFDGHLFSELYSLDFAIGCAYEQKKLPGT